MKKNILKWSENFYIWKRCLSKDIEKDVKKREIINFTDIFEQIV